jgi:hypothetical protein
MYVCIYVCIYDIYLRDGKSQKEREEAKENGKVGDVYKSIYIYTYKSIDVQHDIFV